MNLKKIILSLFLVLTLVSCSKKEETYEKRDVKVDSVFDNINIDSNEESKERDKGSSENNDQKKEKGEDKALASGDKIKAKTTANVNLRESPTTNEDNFITSVPRGESVEILEEVESNGETWTKVSYNGKEGFVKSNFIEN